MERTPSKGNVDAVLKALGCFGVYCISQHVMILVSLWSVGLVMLSVVFTGQQTPFRCRDSHAFLNNSGPLISDNGQNETSVFWRTNITTSAFGDVCEILSPTALNISQNITQTTTCSAYEVEYQNDEDMFFVSEFDLVCDREYLIGMSQTLLTLGHLVASFIFPYFTDRFGRKPVILLCGVFSLITNIGISVSTNYSVFAAFKFLVGVFIQGLEGVAVTMYMETIVTKYRGKMFAALGSLNWTCGLLLLGLIAYLLSDYTWRVLEYTICASFIFIIFHVLFLTETLRWLAANDKVSKLHDTIRRVSHWDRKDSNTVIEALYAFPKIEQDQKRVNDQEQHFVFRETDRHSIENLHTAETEHLTFFSLFKDPQLRIHTIFCCIAWFFNSFTYFALTLMSSTLHGSIYLNYTLNCLAELPQVFFMFFFLDRVGRRMCFTIFSMITGLSLLAMAVVRTLAPEQFLAITVLSVMGKIGVTGSFNVMYTYTPELFPTNLRNMGLGTSYLGARIGGMLAPFAELLMKKVVYGPGLIFGVSSLVLSAFPFFLPETTGVQIPQSLREMRQWKKGYSLGRRSTKGDREIRPV